MNIEDIKKKIKNNTKKSNSKCLNKYIIKTMILIILFLLTIILLKNSTYKTWINKNILSKNMSFSNIQTIYKKYLGSILPFDSYFATKSVFSEKLVYSNINKYKDGICLTVASNYLVPIQYSGIVTFIGEKDGYGSTIIIESNNITIWYSNLNNYNVKLYDNVEQGQYLGETIDDKLYLIFYKEGNIINYKDYI